MSRNHDRELSEADFYNLQQVTSHGSALAESFTSRAGELRKMKKFRFQLLHRWLTTHFEPCRVADIGGGKGLLAYLLQESGWDTAVIDPIHQALPDKYKDITHNRRVKITADSRVPHVDRPFVQAMGQQFDLLIGMHAHACNIAIIEAAVEFGCGFVLFPCCVIDEPLLPPIGQGWLECVADYAIGRGIPVTPFRLNFKGQNIGLYGMGQKFRRLAASRTVLG